MLVLTRRPNEQIQIGDHRITVTVLDVRGGRVRLGIDAPSTIGIRRREVVVPVESVDDREHSRV